MTGHGGAPTIAAEEQIVTTEVSGEDGARPSACNPLNPQELLSLAVHRVREGKLACDHQARLFAGPGRHTCCSLCNVAIGVEDIEYEVEMAKGGSSRQPLSFHRPCYYAWLQACTYEGHNGNA